jgi:hypothetical protein
MVRTNVWTAVPILRVMWATVAVETPVVGTGNVTDVAPAGTITEVGTVAAALSLEVRTVKAAGPALALRFILQEPGLPPTTVGAAKVQVPSPTGTTFRVVVLLEAGST